MNIKEVVTIHDRFQFEIKQSYGISSDRSSNSYHVKTYFFLPNSLNINKDTYGRDDFYRDMRSTIRLKTPSLLLKDINEDSEWENSIIDSLDKYITTGDKTRAVEFESQIKLFCLTLIKAMDVQINFIFGASSIEEMYFLADEFIVVVPCLAKRFRGIGTRIRAGGDCAAQRKLFAFADEYLSLRIEAHLFWLLSALEKNRKLMSKNKAKVLNIVKSEIRHRDGLGYASVPSLHGSNETYVFRQGSLKKYMHNILYLETRIGKSRKYVEQTLYSIAAGVAMVFATAVVFVGQSRYGNLTLPFFIAMVVSYVFKDRMKDFMRYYFHASIHKWLYDRVRNIYHRFDEKIGTCNESFDIITERQLPPFIMAHRDRDGMVDMHNGMVGEEVILYRKYIKFNGKRFHKIKKSYRTDGITDIMRYNVQSFLRGMDNPEKRIAIPHKKGYVSSRAIRVYHINIITHFVIDNTDHIRRFRLILNRDGIQRVEEVSI
jgi:hypothetical protein